MNLALNFLAFQVGWFACVLGAANGFAWVGALAVLAAAVLHLRRARRPGGELRLLLAAMALGLVLDSLLLATGWVAYPGSFPGGQWLPALAPYWLVAMWALFATTLNVSMGWLRGRPLLAALFGAIGGPLSYWAGARLGAMELLQPVAALAALAVVWALAMPLLLRLAERYDGFRERRNPAYILSDWGASEHA
jgi:hypothetical protein